MAKRCSWSLPAILVLFAGCAGAEHEGSPDAAVAEADADGDTISDADEGATDFDGDQLANDHDLDADGDGLPDATEAGDADLATAPFDSDGDGAANFLDLDADNDGLSDERETAVGTDPLDADTDDDGDSDLAEVTLHDLCVSAPDECNGDPDPLDPARGVSPEDFVFVLPYRGPEQTGALTFATAIATADVQISIDTTGSMEQEIGRLQDGLQSVISQITSPIDGVPSVGIGVSGYEEFPREPYGFDDQLPFRLLQRVTTLPKEAQVGVNALQTRGGYDIPEAGWEALYQIATGAGATWDGPTAVPAFAPMLNYDPSTHGLLGGVGFRAEALPIIVQIGDAAFHLPDDTAALCENVRMQYLGPIASFAHSKADTIAALQALGARVLGIASGESTLESGCNPRPDLEEVARATGAMVEPAAFDLGGRPEGCAPSDCCTGLDGTGLAPDVDTGLCPLVFDVHADGSGDFAGKIVNAIRSLVKFTPIDVSTALSSSPQPDASGALVDPAMFIGDISPAGLAPSPASGVQLDPSGEAFLDVPPGTAATFDVAAENTFVEQVDEPQVFTLKLHVIGDQVTTLDTHQIVVIVPARLIVE